MTLEKRLKELREARGLSVKDMAESVNMAESTYRGYEYGAKLPANKVPQLCQKLGVSLVEFYNFEMSTQEVKNDFEFVIQKLEFYVKRLSSFKEITKPKKNNENQIT